jgi:hypothetical protein
MSARATIVASAAVLLSLCATERARAGAPAPERETPAPPTTGGRAPDPDEPAAERPTREFGRSALGTAAAVVPGLVVHGTGHLVIGESKTGLRLLAIEGVGLGTLAAGFVPGLLSGASRRVMGPALALGATGLGLIAISFLADVYGVVAPAGGVGVPFRVAPTLQVSLGYRYVYDPVFSYRNFVVQDIDYRTGPWRLHPSAWFALDDTNSRLTAQVAYRLSGPRPRGDSPPSSDGSFLDLEAAITRHAFTSEGFTTTAGELVIAGRLDMSRVGPSLRGSFAEMSLGVAMQAYSYAARGTTADVAERLLTRFAYGLYLGFAGSPRGEVAIYHQSRQDGFAAGLKLPGLANGVVGPGHFGAVGQLFLTSQWGIAMEAAVGSAYVTGLSIVYRHGEPL